MTTNPTNSSSRRLEQSWTIATTFLAVATASLIILVTLALTIFRPQNPTFTVWLVGMPTIRLEDIIGAKKNVTISAVVGLSNSNYASFTWKSFTALVEYKGEPVGVVAVDGGIVLQRSKMNVSTSAAIITRRDDKLGFDRPGVVEDVVDALSGGGLNFSCSKTMFGRVKVFDVLPGMRGSISIECFSSMYVNNYTAVARKHGLFRGQAWCRAVKKKIILARS